MKAKVNDPTWDRAFGSGATKKFREKVQRKKRSEQSEQYELAKFMREEFPGVRFYSSLDGLFRGKRQGSQVKAMQHSTGFPDFFVFKGVGKYTMLVIELKRTGTVLVNKNGSVRSNEHIERQAGWLAYLDQNCRAKTTFAIGIEEAKKIITKYLTHGV